MNVIEKLIKSLFSKGDNWELTDKFYVESEKFKDAYDLAGVDWKIIFHVYHTYTKGTKVKTQLVSKKRVLRDADGDLYQIITEQLKVDGYFKKGLVLSPHSI